jgi:aminopeptidase N
VEPFHRMQVDLYANMKLHRVMYGNKSLPFTREYDAVFVQFPHDLVPGEEEQITMYYDGIPQTPDWSIPMNGGALWDKDSLGNAWAQMVCQGSGASLWWPNKDHLSDEPDSMKIWITAPPGYTEISNGRLQRKTTMPDGNIRHEWYVSYPINNYNVTYSIGKYAHFTDQYISNDTLTIDYYVMPYNEQRSKNIFAQVKPMLTCFEKNFGKYPFKRDGFALLESLYPMEHQSGVCIGKITQQNSVETNPLPWHEVAHEWWGNSISCTDLADMWIHEAFATYAEALMFEWLFGKEAAYEWVRNEQPGMTGAEPVIGVYDVNHIFYDINDMYTKGSLMLHTFRNVINNDVQWVNLLRAIQDNFRYKTLTTDDLVKFINTYMKKDYTYLFDQYLRYVSLPELQLELTEQPTGLVVKYRWQADAANFRMPVKVTVGRDRFDYIYPTPSWKTITLKGMTAAGFEADEDNFLMDVTVLEAGHE